MFENIEIKQVKKNAWKRFQIKVNGNRLGSDYMYLYMYIYSVTSDCMFCASFDSVAPGESNADYDNPGPWGELFNG